MSVEPYREICFDQDGDGPPGQAPALAALARQGVSDLFLLAHGRNGSPSGATRLCSDFFAPFPGLLAPGVEAGYAGVVWPSAVFTGEPGRDHRALATVLPEKEPVLERLTGLLASGPAREAEFAEFGALLRELADVADAGGPVPAFLVADPVEVCGRFADALDPDLPEGPERYRRGAREALRQTAHHVLGRRAGHVGEHGLGPLLGEVARAAPGLRVHLVGHGAGARLVAYALRGLPAGTRPVASVTLLQGSFSHYAFAARLPHAPERAGALRGLELRIRGPLVVCHSRHDAALGVLYPMASRLADDPGPIGADDPRRGAIGHDGARAVPGTVARSLAAVLRTGVPGAGCVNVDTAEVVRSHDDLCRPELARVVVSASGTGRRR
ncbi:MULTISPECIES: serine-threonine protein kinase [unclassified Streptomyces]|uniref:serine-threonine protein kinase n=1 Tax=unclassified Streptomyces TaxID=2593676 RepID=UPI003809AFBC